MLEYHPLIHITNFLKYLRVFAVCQTGFVQCGSFRIDSAYSNWWILVRRIAHPQNISMAYLSTQDHFYSTIFATFVLSVRLESAPSRLGILDKERSLIPMLYMRLLFHG